MAIRSSFAASALRCGATALIMAAFATQAWAIELRLLIAPTGEASGDRFGWSVATAGDVNGDGYADVIVGADHNDAGGASAGRAYVYYGGPGADADADLILTGEAAGDWFGHSVGTAGDVNGDGFADLIVGAPSADGSRGRAYVYHGGPAADATADLTLAGGPSNDAFGISVGTAGDVNGDGFDDVIVGALPGSDFGKAFVYYGGAGADSIADLILTEETDLLGGAVGTAGDVNGDGFSDLIVGAGNFLDEGAYVYYGGSSADATADYILTGEANGDWFGWSVGTAGDVNGDGFSDFIVGAPYNDAVRTDAGRAYVYYGGPVADATPDLTLSGGIQAANLGRSVGTAGDVDGDGFADLIVGLSNRAHVYLGGPGADAAADVILTGEGGEFGRSVGTAGDVDGDGFADVVIGAFEAGALNGRAYVYGRLVPVPAVTTWGIAAFGFLVMAAGVLRLRRRTS